MSTTNKAVTATTNVFGRSIIPFTGAIFAIWAFFSPESYGRWLGEIVKAFRATSGI